MSLLSCGSNAEVRLGNTSKQNGRQSTILNLTVESLLGKSEKNLGFRTVCSQAKASGARKSFHHKVLYFSIGLIPLPFLAQGQKIRDYFGYFTFQVNPFYLFGACCYQAKKSLLSRLHSANIKGLGNNARGVILCITQHDKLLNFETNINYVTFLIIQETLLYKNRDKMKKKIFF